MDSITRIKDFIRSNFPEWEKVDFSHFEESVDFRQEWSELYKINGEEIILISYTNISITGTDRQKPQLRVFLDEYKKPFYFAKKHQLRFYLFSIFTKEDNMARGLTNFNPKEYIISIETNLDLEGSRRDLRSIYDYANAVLKGRKFLKCTRANYKADINQASFIYVGTPEKPEKEIFENFINIFDSRPYINSTNEVNTALIPKADLESEDDNMICYLTAIRTKPFLLLAGISGTGKSRIVRKLAQATDDIDSFEKDEDRWRLHKPANFELIQVKPNWHNSMDVVGFQSNIPEPHYEFTPFVDFVVKAWCHEDTPFFLCLDEMNLAPVEEYFAEFLSAIESRSVGEDGEFETDPIIKPFDSFGTELSGKMMNHYIEMGYDLPREVEERLRKKGLTLPKNLIVMGTVNMDETTFSFSRKVLDRAMSIEMNEVNYDDFIAGKTEYDIPLLTAQNGLLVNRPISAQEVKEGIESQEVMDFLKGVNDILDGTPFKLGYRAANEAMLYVAADKQFGANNLKAALDNFTLMKILSRIEGDDSKLVTQQGDKLLDKLYVLLSSETVFGSLEKSKSLAKLSNMQDTLKRDHFVSFWG
jgi:hypothetical protein